MTDPEPPRYFLEFVARDNVYQLIDRTTGQAGGRYADYSTALRAVEIANRAHEQEQLYREALVRASGRPT